MYSLKSKWKHMRWHERIAFIIGIPSTAAIIFLAILHIAGIRTTSLAIYAALVVLVMLSQAIQHWRKNRRASLISLGTAIFVVIAFVLVYVL